MENGCGAAPVRTCQRRALFQASAPSAEVGAAFLEEGLGALELLTGLDQTEATKALVLIRSGAMSSASLR